MFLSLCQLVEPNTRLSFGSQINQTNANLKPIKRRQFPFARVALAPVVGFEFVGEICIIKREARVGQTKQASKQTNKSETKQQKQQQRQPDAT